MDAELRVSRSRVGIVDQLRVFVRSDPKAGAAADADADLKVQDDTVEDSQSTTTEDYLDDSLAEAPSDVEPQPTTTEDYLDSLAEAPSDVEVEDTTQESSGDVDAPSDVE
jgi:hypothetical protein